MCQYRTQFHFSGISERDHYGNIISPYHEIKPNYNKGQLDKCFDIQDAVVVEEIKHGTVEYWHSEYSRLTALMNDLKAVGDLNCQEAKDIQCNVKFLMDKLKNYELTKSK